MSKLGVGVIGVGEMGKCHAANLRHLVPEVRLVGLADTDAVRGRAVAAELEIETAETSLEALLARPDVHAVVISSPPKFHAHAVRVAAAAGKAIFCEKPLAVTLEDADSALAAVARAGVCLQIGHMRRYDPAYAAAYKRIEAGEIGEPVIFKSIGRDPEAPPASYFQSGNGSLFLDSTVHDFDLARWLMNDEVAEVHAFTAALACPEVAQFDAFDSGVVNLRFARGGIGNIESFMQARYGYDVRTEVVGTKGTLKVGSLNGFALQVLSREGSSRNVVGHWRERFADAYLAEMRDFVRIVLTGGTPSVTGHDGREAVAVALAAQQSGRESRPVRLSAMAPNAG